jgi:predicted patatin/cPLA2 family phospholipase
VKTGLIMEGGAMRGLFTAGVIDVFMEHNIIFDGAIGVSAGAAFGCNYKSRQIGRVIRYKTKFVQDRRYCGFPVLLKTGNYYSTEFCYGEVPLKYDIFDFDACQSNPMKFYVVCTDITTGKPVYHEFTGKKEEGFDWIRASASMPLVSQIVTINGQKLLDGGISDSVPVQHFERMGYDKNVVILTRPRGYVKKPCGYLPLIRGKYRNYPNMIHAMKHRHEKYNDTMEYIRKQEQAGNLLVIAPKEPLPLSRVERKPENLRKAYEIGRTAGMEYLERVKKFLSL